MTKTKAWALKDSSDRYVKTYLAPHEPFKTMLFRTQRDATNWVNGDSYWKNKAVPVRVVITVKEVGEP